MDFTYGSMAMLAAIVPESLAFLFALRGYLRTKYPHFMYMAATWFFLMLGSILISIAYLTLNLTIYKLGILATVPLAFAIMGLADSITREHLDPWKLFIVTAVAVAILVTSFDENAVCLHETKLGEITPELQGRFMIAGALTFIVVGGLWLYSMVKIYLHSPCSLKKISLLNLIAAIIAGPGSAIAFSSGIVWYIPGVDYLFIGIGALICSYAFAREPKLAYVLPFKVYHLDAIDLVSGIPLFSYMWEREEEERFDTILFSGALQGISLLLKESLGKGLVKEIHLEDGILVIHRNQELELAYVLLTSHTNKILREGLTLFAEQFEKAYSKELRGFRGDVSQYEKAEAIVQKAFPFVVAKGKRKIKPYGGTPHAAAT